MLLLPFALHADHKHSQRDPQRLVRLRLRLGVRLRLRLMAMVTPSTLKETRLVAVVVLEALVVV